MLRNTLAPLLERRPIPARDVVHVMAVSAVTATPDDMLAVGAIADMDEPFDQIIAYPALALLPAWGEQGLALLERFVLRGPHRHAAMMVLAELAAGRLPERRDFPFLREEWDEIPRYRIEPSLPALATQSLRATILSAMSDPDAASNLLFSIAFQTFSPDLEASGRRLGLLLRLIVDNQLLINQELLDEFRAALDAGPDREEDLHRFLLANPILLDPLAIELRTKHELGTDFIADFVVRRANDSYAVIEIENSTHLLFNSRGHLTSQVLTAEGQVRDFQAWIHQNIAYAQRKLPNIHRPEGLIVIGRRKTMDPMMQRRLEEENFMRRSLMRIVTYDDLLDQATTIYSNMLKRPIVLATRDQQIL